MSLQPQPSPELEAAIRDFIGALREQYLPDDSILDRATPRWEYRKCRKWYKDKLGPGWWSTVRNVFKMVITSVGHRGVEERMGTRSIINSCRRKTYKGIARENLRIFDKYQ